MLRVCKKPTPASGSHHRAVAAQAFDRGKQDMQLGAKAKLFSAQIATEICMEGIQLLGGYGYSREYPVERYMRDAKLMEIGAGTNEIMRVIISRRILQEGATEVLR